MYRSESSFQWKLPQTSLAVAGQRLHAKPQTAQPLRAALCLEQFLHHVRNGYQNHCNNELHVHVHELHSQATETRSSTTARRTSEAHHTVTLATETRSSTTDTSSEAHHTGHKYKTKGVPSSSSRLAPPPVLTWLTLSSAPNFAAHVAVSPPPADDIQRAPSPGAFYYSNFELTDEKFKLFHQIKATWTGAVENLYLNITFFFSKMETLCGWPLQTERLMQ